MKKFFLILLLSFAYSAHAQTTTISAQKDNNTSACATTNSPVVGSQSCSNNTLDMTDDCSIPNSGNCNTGANTVIFNEAPANIADFTNDGMNPHTIPYSGFNGKLLGHWIPWLDCPGTAGDCIYTPKLPASPGPNTFSNHVVTGFSSHGANQVIAELKQFCRMGLDGFIDDWNGMQFAAASSARKNQDVALQLMVAGMSSQSCASSMKFALALDQAIFHTSATCGTSSQTPSCAEKAWEDSLDWANLSTNFTSRIDSGTYTGQGYALDSHYLWMNCTSLGCSFTPAGTGHPVFGTFVSESDHFSTCSGCAVWNNGVAGVTCTGSSDCWNKVWAGIANHVATYAHKPYFIFRNSFTNHASQNDGSYRWANPTTTQSNWDQSGYGTWLNTAAAGPTCNGHKCIAFGAAYKGIDHAQSGFQTDNFIIDQRCGKTWLDTLKEPALHGFSSSNQLQAIQLNTISDYDEGTEIQTGIDSCYSLAATMGGDGHTLSYSMTTSDSSAAPLLPLNATVNHFAIFYSSDAVNATRIIPPVGMASAGSIDLNSLSIPAGSYTVYLKMVGQFSIKNKIVGPYSYTSSTGGGGGSSGTGPTNKIDINTQTAFHYVSDTGAANAYAVAVHAAPAYYSGMPVVFLPAHNNTTTSTINVNGLGVKTIKKQTSIGLADVAASDIQTSIITFLVYDGTYFELIGPFGNGGGGHNLLSTSHSDTTAAAAIRGDGIFAIGGTPTWQRLAHSSATGGYFKWNGTDIVASTNAAAGPGTCTNQVVTANNADAAPTCTSITSAYTTGSFTAAAHNLLSAIHGDTATASATRGDIIAAIGVSPLWTRLAHSSATGGYWKWNGTDVVASTGAAGGTGACSSSQFETTDNADGAPTCAQPAIADLQNIAADTVVQNSTGSAAAPIATAVPNCASDNAHALVYSTSSHAWTCQAISGGVGGIAVQPIVSKSANYTITTSDFSALDAFIFTCTSSCDATLPASPPATNGQFVTIKNNGTGSLFVMPNGLTLDTQAAPVLVPVGYSVEIVTDASNYFSKNMMSHSQFASRRRAQVVAHGSANIIVVGTAVSATHNGAITSNSATATEGQFENSATSATANNCADDVEVGGMWGIASTASNVRWSGRFGIDDGAAGVTNIRMFVGLTDTASTIAQYCSGTATDAPTQNAIVFRCSSNASDTNWMAMVSRNTGATAVSTGVACNTTNHTFAIQEHGGATAYFYIDGVMRICIGTDTGCTSASSKYPVFAAARMFSGIQTLTTAARNLHFFWMETESDH